ncbi:LysR family transcriptional regulator [Phaeobacter gallaeciensis]|uniref:LysR family transcriptional regulator n=1 Tax=Phaeobacter gallaeciensis TaxID=60890 RepID=A0A1B0ZX81_9RHOB|nr:MULTISPECIES: LysR family transcriptional regulator [Phaeobacter]MEE2634743.1 LysR family transcriptional regulator [Pseudomonadota bacterium]ANP38704.1 LysR family transcriptional regulator [Phaeobacter gallaeciensis]MDE4061751.1 LysR family transcriptional regulator [Phaeobacter gallaeciensis]MDE4124771.1 LysR family transcriptional regulator [Phaeobacter gallaeciensis]MDE4129302.1 LysR family transcriptional regulator [Phaeobacter gallaeciensis]
MSYLDNIRTFVRVYELGSMSAAGRDLRISPAVTSARISQLEDYLGVRLFQRTTRNLTATEQGQVFYSGAVTVLDAVDQAEAKVMHLTDAPRGTLFVAAPLGVGRRLVAPAVPEFLASYPEINLRLRLSDRAVDLTTEGLDLAFFLGQPEDSTLRIRKIADCRRVLVAAPEYIARCGMPKDGAALIREGHNCLNLRYPGASEFQWMLQTPEGPQRFAVSGRYECDDGDVLTDWALAGKGIALKPVFEVAPHLEAGRLVPVATATPPVPVQMACLYTHRRHQDPKTRLFMDFMTERMARAMRQTETGAEDPGA